MSILLRWPHSFIRRNLVNFERVLVSSGLAFILYSALSSFSTYPPFWDGVIVALVFGVTLWAPLGGYLLAVAAFTYPLYSISLYLAVLFLAVALIFHRVFVFNLGATVVVLIAPWLAPFYLVFAVPLLGGLWWGTSGGALIGGTAALWGLLIAAMSGSNPDWLARLGSAPGSSGIIERFSAANSLETLMLILEPLAPDPTLLLYYLLQLILWASIGGLIGWFADRAWAQKRAPWGAVALTWIGAVSLAAAHLFLGLWLRLFTGNALSFLWEPTLLATLLAAILVSMLAIIHNILEHPLPVRRRPQQRTQPQAKPEISPKPLRMPPEVQPQADDQEGEDLIMLELD